MRLINRSADYTIFVRGFPAGDRIYGAGVGDAGKIAPGQAVEIGMTSNPVQLEVKHNWVFGAPIMKADPNQLFPSSITVIFTGERLVGLTSELLSLMNPGGYVDDTQPNKPTQLAVDFARVSTATLALLEGLISGYAPAGMAKGVGVGTVKMASVLVGIFANQSSVPSLKLDDITASMEKVLDEHEARVRVPAILAATTWFDSYVQKSRDKLKSATDPSGIDLSDYDRKEFEKELNQHLDGLTPFIPSLDIFTSNRSIRKYVIPEYILGVSLYLQLRRIELILKQAKTPLDAHDIKAIKDKAEDFFKALQQSEEDFVELRKKIIHDYPIASWESSSGWYDDFNSELVPPQPEADKLRRGLVFKYLKGDRWIIKKALGSLDQMVTNLAQIPVS